MTKTEAIYNFFNDFMTAYPDTAVPDDAVFPWLTYSNVMPCAYDDPVACTVNLWFHTDSEAEPNRKAEELAELIGAGGKQISYDDGTIWIKRGTPWCTALNDANDNSIKRRMINVELEVH